MFDRFIFWHFLNFVMVLHDLICIIFFTFFQPQPQTQLPSGHVEQRERNGRIISVPQPIRLPNGGGGGGTSPSPYMTVPSPSPYGPADHGYLTASGMRHQYVQQH